MEISALEYPELWNMMNHGDLNREHDDEPMNH